jgi:hypothetical protein
MTKELVDRLRNTPNWQRESYGDWKQGTVHYDRAPFEAADAIESLQAENERLKRQLDAGKDVWRQDQKFILQAIAERDALAAKLVPMTDEQIYNVFAETVEEAEPFSELVADPIWIEVVEITRAIESAHGIQAIDEAKGVQQ